MLLTRCILFLVFATNSTEKSILTNTFAVTLVVMGILIIRTRISNIYNQVYIEILELCFLLNLGVLSTTLCYLLGKDNSENYVHKAIMVSISVSFIMFLGILAHHTYLQIKKTKYYPAFEHLLLKRRWQRQHQTVQTDPNHLNSVVLNNKLPTTTTIELSEKLLECSH